MPTATGRFARKEGFNPVKKEKIMAKRRELSADYELPLGEDYRKFVLRFLDEEMKVRG